ncbi:MAG TPA: hypothetical protein VJQ46_06235 [Gemmatimonadales bacterium]|nr:hypothetical protein [Gemmatimonadales bacterium]
MPDDNACTRMRPRMARLRSGLEAQHPSLSRQWYRVLDRNDSALTPVPPAGQLWIEVGPRLRLLPEELFEFSEDAAAG